MYKPILLNLVMVITVDPDNVRYCSDHCRCIDGHTCRLTNEPIHDNQRTEACLIAEASASFAGIQGAVSADQNYISVRGGKVQ